MKKDDLFVLDAIGLAWKCILAKISAISYATFVLLRVNQLALFEAKVLDMILIQAQQQIHHHHPPPPSPPPLLLLLLLLLLIC